MPALLLSLTLILAGSLNSGNPTAERWAKTLEETSTLLRDQKFDDARKRLEKLKRDMLEKIGPGAPADRLFAIAIGQLAVAQAGAGDTEEAIWNWQAAQNIDPAVREVDLSMYGAAGQLLKDNLLGPRPEFCVDRLGIRPPPLMPKKRVEPKYPKGAAAFGESGIMIVRIRRDENGHPREPYVLKGLAAPITYSALDALRRWEFHPPKPDEMPTFCVTFNFRIK